MQHTGKTLAALFVGATLAAPASAVPITFDLAGTVAQRSVMDGGVQWDDPDAVGVAWNARFVIETDLFGPRQSGGFEYARQASFVGSPGAVTPSLSIGGQAIDVTRLANDSARIHASDSLGVIYEPNGVDFGVAADQWGIDVRSYETDAAGVTEQVYFQLGFFDYFDVATMSGGMDMFAIEDITSPESLLSLPLAGERWTRSIEYFTERYSCAPVCQFFGSDNWSLNVSSVTRSVGTAVPEPASLALLLTGLAGVFGLRRRRAAA